MKKYIIQKDIKSKRTKRGSVTGMMPFAQLELDEFFQVDLREVNESTIRSAVYYFNKRNKAKLILQEHVGYIYNVRRIL